MGQGERTQLGNPFHMIRMAMGEEYAIQTLQTVCNGLLPEIQPRVDDYCPSVRTDAGRCAKTRILGIFGCADRAAAAQSGYPV